MLNEEQEAHVRALLTNPDKVCGCGWYWKEECARQCWNLEKRQPEEAKVNSAILDERERNARKIEDYIKKHYWRLADADADARRRVESSLLQRMADMIRKNEYP